MNSYLSGRLKSVGLDSRIQKDELKARLLLLNERIEDKILHNKYMRMIISGNIHDAEFDEDNKTFCFIKYPISF